MKVYDHLKLLGMRATDKVTGLNGVITSVCFDLFGCVQAAVHPGVDADKKMKESFWMDVSRLTIEGAEPVMERPNFEIGPVAEGKQGAADKPSFIKS